MRQTRLIARLRHSASPPEITQMRYSLSARAVKYWKRRDTCATPLNSSKKYCNSLAPGTFRMQQPLATRWLDWGEHDVNGTNWMPPFTMSKLALHAGSRRRSHMYCCAV